MAKYEYTDGECRYYRGVPICYDLKGDFQAGYNEIYHWYIETCTSINGSWYAKKPVTHYQMHKLYFKTLTAAKKYIDDF
jgi:hypothetical protein